MGVQLKKGGRVNLSKRASGLKNVHVGLGWDERLSSGAPFDLDAVAFMLNQQNRVAKDEDFIFYNNLISSCGAIEHQGDNRTGEGEGDDEIIFVHLEKVPSYVKRIVFAVTIYEAEERNQTFGMIRDAFIRLVNLDTGEEMARYDLSKTHATETSMVFGELYRQGQDWFFEAIGQAREGGLYELAYSYGVNV